MAFSTFQGPNFVFEVIQPGAGSIPALLAQRARTAIAAGRVGCVYLTARWCGANKSLENALGDARMQQALRDVDAAAFDIDAWGDELATAGFAIATVPAFFILDEAGKPTRSITGAAWKEDTAENMAPPLTGFFDAARGARPAATPAAQPPASKKLAIAAVILGFAGVGVAAWLKVSSDNKAKQAQFDREQSDRIKKDVDAALHHR